MRLGSASNPRPSLNAYGMTLAQEQLSLSPVLSSVNSIEVHCGDSYVNTYP
jgi:hypothetical protein